MDPTALAALISQLLTVGIQVYNGLRAANPATVPPLATILAQADADWQAVANEAAAQLKPPAA
jgi:hypothetical protein